MSRFTFLIRGLTAAAALIAGTAAAQPANDLCANAIAITPSATPNAPVVTSEVSILTATMASEAPGFSCQPTNGYSIWYTVTPTVTGLYRFETCTATAPKDTVPDTVISLYAGACGSLAEAGCSDDFCGARSSLVISLTAGTPYLLQVAKFGTTAPATGLDTIQLSTTLLAAPANDRCDGTVPSLALNTPRPFATNGLANDDSQIGGGSACYVGLGHSTLTLNAPGRDVVFNFTPPNTGAYNVRLTAPSNSLNSILYMTDSCVAAMTPPQSYAPPQCIAASNRVGSSIVSQEELTCVSLNSGTPYFIWADESSLSVGGASYEVEVTRCIQESEPNGTPASAGPLSCPVTGSITPAGDADFYSLGTNPTGSRVFALVEAASSGSAGSSSNDFDLRVTTATDTLEYDDANADTLFGGLSGAVAGTPLPNVPTFLRTSHFSGIALEPYRLYSTVQTGVATAEVEPNNTTAQATAGNLNYFSGDVASTADVDMFAFGARVGDLVFLAVDSQPARTGTTATGNHTLQLLNAAGAPLVAVNDSGTAVNNTIVTGSLTSTSPALPSETLVYRIRANGMYFARVGRTSTTGTGPYLLSISVNCGTGGGLIGAPTLSSLTPSTGTVSGGTTVTLSGTNFSSAAVVTFGGVLATVVNRSSTSLEVLTPVGTDGAVDVRVINPGELFASLPNGFTYFTPVLPPTVTSVAPNTGPTAGSTVITVNGTLFKAGAQVTLTVGGVAIPATSVVIVNFSQLRATTPAHTAGPAIVTVRNPVDALQGSLAAGFTYLAPPTLTSVTPPTGFTSGGQTVTLQGTAFRPGATVRFGAAAGAGVVVDSSGNSLTVITPSALLAGVVDVTIVNADTQQAVLTGAFTYSYPAPVIISVTPAQGYTLGGTTITIVGSGFQPLPTVTVGGNAATNVIRTSLNQITAVTPPGAAGLADVTVTNTDTQSVTRTGGFRYVPPPVLTSVSPANGPVQGGTLITLTGTDFLPGASVRLGGVPAFAVTVTSPTTATALTNSNAAGVVDVVLTNPDLQTSTLAAAFTYDPAPTLASISPISGTTTGGTVVTLTGSGFLTGATVLFGTDAATNVTVVSATQLTATTPARAVGVVSVTVRNVDNQSAVLERAYRFVAPPTVTAAAPNTGDVIGGTVVRLTGTGFTAGTTVTFGGMAAAQVSLVSATELDAVTAPHIPDTVDIQVSTDGATATLANAFTFTRSVPTLSALAPPSGPVAGGTLLTLTGTGFAPGAIITVGGARATAVVIVSNVLARAVVPAHAAGVVDVVFTNDDAKAATLAGAFTFVAPASSTEGFADGGDGSIGQGPTGGGGGAGGISCGCSSFDGSMFSMAGFGLLMVLSRRRRFRSA